MGEFTEFQRRRVPSSALWSAPNAHAEQFELSQVHQKLPSAHSVPAYRHNFSQLAIFPAPVTIQPKLTVNTLGDRYEQEADTVAEQVMRMVEPTMTPSVVGTTSASIQRCARCGGTHTHTASAPEEDHSQEMCPACAAAAQQEAHLQAKETAGATPTVTSAVQATIDGMRGGGQSLDGMTRAFMEPRFGHSFADVRVHTDERAVEASRAVNALAFTIGHDIAFNAGQYQPESSVGRQLLAHELTHVVQQTGIVQRVHIEDGRKKFDNTDYIGDAKLEACLNDEDRLSPFETGPSVTRVQNGLQKDGMDLGKDGVNGIYGADTGQAVMAFKKKYNLGFTQFPDVGPGTMKKLDGEPAPPTPVKPEHEIPEKCFESIDWEAFFEQKTPECEAINTGISLACQANHPLLTIFPWLDPTGCAQLPSFEKRVEECVLFDGFTLLVENCGIPSSPPGKAEIRERFHKWAATRPIQQQDTTSDESNPSQVVPDNTND